MTATGVTLRGRNAAEAQMLDACTIVRPDGTHATDPTSGAVSYGGTPAYAGKCKVQMPAGSAAAQPREFGESAVQVEPVIVSVPVAVAGVKVGDVITITASALDPDLPGRVMHVRQIAAKTFLTARRLICEEVTG